jgi:hypothetical protein
MQTRSHLRFTFGIVLGVVLIIWSVYSLMSLSRSPTQQSISHYRGAPVTQQQIAWGMFFLGGVFIAAAFALRTRQ